MFLDNQCFHMIRPLLGYLETTALTPHAGHVTMNRSLILLPLLILWAWTSPFTSHAEPARLTLEACLERALPYADAIKITEESLYAAEQDRLRARSVLVPSIELTGRVSGEVTDLSGASASPFNITEKSLGSFVGLGFKYSFYVNGRELIVYKASGELVDKAGMDLQAARQDYMLQVASAFIACIRSDRGMAIAEANLDRLTAHGNAVTRRIQAGLLTKTERFRSDAELAQGRADLAEARNQKALSRRALHRLVPLAEGVDLAEPSGVPAPAAPTLDGWVELAEKSRPELKALRLSSRVADKEVAVTRSTYWPKLTLEGSAGRGESRVDGSYDSRDADFTQESTLYSASLTLSLPLVDGGLRRADLRKSLSAKRSVDHRMRQVEKEIRLAVEQAWYDLGTETQRTQALEEGLTYARQFLEAVTRQFDQGLAQSLDLTDANTRLLEAENRVSDARFALHLAALRLRHASGLPPVAIANPHGRAPKESPTPEAP